MYASIYNKNALCTCVCIYEMIFSCNCSRIANVCRLLAKLYTNSHAARYNRYLPLVVFVALQSSRSITKLQQESNKINMLKTNNGT